MLEKWQAVCHINKLTNSFASNYNVSMKIDNTLKLISSLREEINKSLVSEMNKVGIEGLVPSHGDILSKLFQNGEMPKSQIAESIKKRQVDSYNSY